MKFAVGYPLSAEQAEALLEVLGDFQGRVAEIYFPWPDSPSGRSPLGSLAGTVDWQTQGRLEEHLRAFQSLGLKLDLLLNASCYGGYGLSEYLANQVCSLVAHLLDTTGLHVVTTMSPVIAQLLKREFPEIEVRASVNMRLGTLKSLQYVADLFDSFYLQREYNRDLSRIAELKEWCRQEGKELYMLVNSGCLNFCSVQTFHDNLVAHEKEVSAMANLRGLPLAQCWRYYQQRSNWVTFLQNSWVRPEDVHHYEPYFSMVKLATRMHANPCAVLRAYCEGRFAGNLPDLLEPGHGPLFAPYIIDNRLFPTDWFATVTSCDKKCHRCEYCAWVLERVLVKMEDQPVLSSYV
jgi:collagenase-like PrtC family protease